LPLSPALSHGEREKNAPLCTAVREKNATLCTAGEGEKKIPSP
jgi:hypothetical protein